MANGLQIDFRPDRKINFIPDAAVPEPTKPAKPTAASAFRPLGPVGRAYALAPTPEEEPALQEAGRAFLETPLLPLTKLFPEGPPTATITGFKQPSKVAEARALVGEGPSPYETPEIPIGGIARGAAEVAESLTTPFNIALLTSIGLTGGAFPLVSRLISGGFSVDLIRGAVQEYPELREALNSGDEQRAAQVATRMGLTGVLAALTGRHAVRGRAAAGEVSRVRPEVERPAEAKPAPKPGIPEPTKAREELVRRQLVLEKPPERALPPPQPVSALEAADLGVSAERVPEVLRRQREAEAVTARAAERQPPRPSPILEEPPLPRVPRAREAEILRDQASRLRDLANSRAKPRTYIRRAEILEAKAATLEKPSQPLREGERGSLRLKEPPPFDPASPEGKVFSRLSKTETAEKTSTTQKLYTMTVDALRPLQRTVTEMERLKGEKLPVEENAYSLSRLLAGWTSKVSEFLENSPFQAKTLKPTGTKPLREILRPFENQLDDLRVYLVSRRAIELAGREKPIETGIPLAEAGAVISRMEAKHPTMRKAAAELQEFQDLVLGYIRDSEMISPEQYQVIKSLNKEYVPFFRVMEQKGLARRIGKEKLGDLWSPIRRIKGSERQIIDPLESIVKNLYTIINLADRNAAMLALVRQAEQFKGSGRFIERVKTPVRPTQFEIGEIKTSLREAGFSEADMKAADLDVLATVFRPSHLSSPKDGILTVMDQGKRRYYKVRDQDLYKALQGLDKESSSLIITLLSKPARMLRLGATGLGPEFLIRNPLRDTMDAWFQSEVGFKPGLDTVRGLTSFLKKDEWYHEWRRGGGEHAALISIDRTTVQKNLRDLMMGRPEWVVRHPIEAARMFSEAMEASTRIGVFRKARAKGLSLRQAGFESREATLDFQRTGAKTRAVNQIVAFWNAAVQGTDKYVRTHRKNPVGALVKGTIGVTVPSLLLYWVNKDDPRYRALPRWERDIFWHISTTGTPLENVTPFVRIPKPFLWGLTYGTFVERFAEWVDEGHPEAWDGFVDSMLEGTLPNIIPTAMRPMLENLTNYDLFRERPIEPRGLERLPPEERAKPYTSEFSKSVIRALARNGISIPGLDSPAKLDHFIYGHTAGGGRAVVQGIDVLLDREGAERPERTAADIPLVRALTTRFPTGGAEPIEKFWQRFEELDQKWQAYRASRKYPGRDVRGQKLSPSEGREYLKLKSYRKRMQNARERIRRISYDLKKSPAQKRQEIEYWMLKNIRWAQEALGREPKVEVPERPVRIDFRPDESVLGGIE